jgi:hypothetical protein
MRGHVGDGVMIEVPHRHAGIQQVQHGGTISLHRQVEDVDFIAGVRLHSLNQGDVALQSSDEGGGRPLMEPPLDGGAKSVGTNDDAARFGATLI